MTTAYKNKPAGLPCPSSSSSFWHTEPNTFLLNHRTTSALPDDVDIVIVGSGITGASIARYLTANNTSLRILMLEARQVCWGATGRNGGHCQPLLFDRTSDVAEFEVKNVDAVRGYIEQNGLTEECEWRVVTGCRTFWEKEAFESASKEIEVLKKERPDVGEKVRAVKWVKGDKECEKVFRQMRVQGDGRCFGITLTEGAGQLWPYKYVCAIVEKAVKDNKINLQTNTPVTKITAVSKESEDFKKGMKQVVSTPRGEVMARHVILATNGYSSHLVPAFASLIVPVRCEMSALHPPEGSERLPNSYGMVGFEGSNPEHDDYLIQRPFYASGPTANGGSKKYGGHLMFGGGRGSAMYNCIGETDDDIVDQGEAAYLRRSLLKMLELGGDISARGLQKGENGELELKASHQWTGIKGYSRDNMPWVGKVPKLSRSGAQAGAVGDSSWEWEDGLWLCGGYTGHGMPNATLCGKAVVEMVLAEEKKSEPGSDAKGYEEICEEMIKNKDLPDSYIITAKRLDAARTLPTVREQEEVSGQVKPGMTNAKQSEKGRSSGGNKCLVM